MSDKESVKLRRVHSCTPENCPFFRMYERKHGVMMQSFSCTYPKYGKKLYSPDIELAYRTHTRCLFCPLDTQGAAVVVSADKLHDKDEIEKVVN
jgi:hypothetical protein